MNKIFLNNCIVDSSQAVISYNDAGFLYGAGLFETMRAANGVVFALDAHLDRLFNSAQKLGVRLAGDKKFFADAVYQTLNANELSDARLRLTVTSGPMNIDEDAKPTTVITAADFEPYPKDYYQKGVTVVLSPCRQNPADGLCGYKTTNYFSRLLALGFARNHQAAEALWFTVDGRLAEGSISNVFIVKDSVLYTPSLETGILDGIARKTVCELAAKNSIKIEQQTLTIKKLLAADEVFITNVIMQVMPVIKIEAHDVKDAKPGAITKKIMALYKEYFDKEVRTA
ncbi:MAG: aminotransferase class IV [Phycisphaerae bacterium]|nr:aminotransferase class IV [Phycisphaerae bacterium]